VVGSRQSIIDDSAERDHASDFQCFAHQLVQAACLDFVQFIFGDAITV